MKEVKKQARKLLSVVMAAVLVLSLSAVTAFAANNTGTIAINNATEGNTYKVYKVFDADGDGTNIRYKLMEGKEDVSLPTGFVVDRAGNVEYRGTGENGALTAADIAAIAAYVKNDQPVASVAAGEKDTSVTVSDLPNGYYYITTTTGAAVTVTSTNPNATVIDKNEAPKLDKKIAGVTEGSLDTDGKKALAQVGATVTYTSTIQVKNGAKGYVFHDVMGSGLSYNDDVKVAVNDIKVDTAYYNTTRADGDTITITFNDDWIKTQVGKTITITYTAKVTSDALTVDTGKNTASIKYGDNNTVTSEPTNVYNAKFTVTKTDGNNQALAGAGFVIAKSVVESGMSKTVYYKKSADNVVSWVENIDNATELKTTDSSNVVTFTGLADGTYTLVEKTVPAGYNKAADSTFTIKADDYTATNLEQSKTVVNKAGSLLPTTGGMGTTVLYVIGGLLVVGAGVALVVRRRMNAGE